MKLPSEIREALRPVKASTVDELDTPCVLIEARRVEAGHARAQEHRREVGVRLGPCVEAHESAAIAHRARRFGGLGATSAGGSARPT